MKLKIFIVSKHNSLYQKFATIKKILLQKKKPMILFAVKKGMINTNIVQNIQPTSSVYIIIKEPV